MGIPDTDVGEVFDEIEPGFEELAEAASDFDVESYRCTNDTGMA
jgi:hypothetical protein